MAETITDAVVISVQRPEAADTAAGHLERALLVGPRTVVAPAERMLEPLREATWLELLLGPPAGEDGPVERMEPAHTHVWWFTDEPVRTSMVVFRLPRATFHPWSTSEMTERGWQQIVSEMRDTGAEGFFDAVVRIGVLSEATRRWPTDEWFADMTRHERRLRGPLLRDRSPFDDPGRAIDWSPLGPRGRRGYGLPCWMTGKCQPDGELRPWVDPVMPGRG